MAQETVNTNQIHPKWGMGLYWLQHINGITSVSQRELARQVKDELNNIGRIDHLHHYYEKYPLCGLKLAKKFIREDWRLDLVKVPKCTDAGFGLRCVEVLLNSGKKLIPENLPYWLSEWWIRDQNY